MRRSILAVCIAFATFLASMPNAEGATILIRPDGTGDQPTIQAGIDAASPGDTVLLAAGVYTGTGNKDLHIASKYFELRSVSGPAATVIDCGGSGRGIHFDGVETAASVVEGITITRGYFSPIPRPVNPYGGGQRWGSEPESLGPALLDDAATADVGAGILIENSALTVANCVFSNNTAIGGGAVYGAGGSTFTDCTFGGNHAEFGGAVDGDGTFTNCTFLENGASNGNGGAVIGGGTFANCTFWGNWALIRGGAVRCGDVSSFTGCVFSGNYARYGGGVAITDGTINSCTFSENGGSGIYVDGAALIENTIVAFTIFDYSYENGLGIECGASGNPTLACCDVFGNAGGDALCGTDGGGNFSADPGFCGSLGSGNYDLKSNSPCAPGNHPGGVACGLIGALPVRCGPVQVRESTWGGIKALYR